MQWTTLQATVTTTNESPFPCMVHFKADPLEDVKDPHSYYMSQEFTENYFTQLSEYSRQLQEYIYDPVSEAYNLRKLLVESSVLCFSKLIMKKDVVVPNFYEWNSMSHMITWCPLLLT